MIESCPALAGSAQRGVPARWLTVRRAPTPLALVCLIAAIALGPSAGAQPDPGTEAQRGLWQQVGGDARAYLTAPLHAQRKQWVRFGATVAAIGVAYHYDDDVRRHFDPPASNAASIDRHDAQDALPAALALGGTWLAATLGHNEDGRREAGAMVEAAAFGSVATYVLKQLAGRERPYMAPDRETWRSDGDSFPSMHVTAAFAIGTVLAESGNSRYRWLRRALGYGLAVATAYERMNHDAHWFSDTVAGAGIGMATARFVLHRQDEAAQRGLTLEPMSGGLRLAYQIPLR